MKGMTDNVATVAAGAGGRLDDSTSVDASSGHSSGNGAGDSDFHGEGISVSFHGDNTSTTFHATTSDKNTNTNTNPTKIANTDTTTITKSRHSCEKSVFRKARQLLDMGNFYRGIIYIYAERKLLVFFGIHFMATMIVWGKYFVDLFVV